ncbi:hypothetical protein ACF0H5_023953 [Mactra antiquata]
MKIRGIIETCFVLAWVFVCTSADVNLSRDNIAAAKRRLRTKFFHGMGKRVDTPYQNQIPYQPMDYNSERGYNFQNEIEEQRFYNDLKQYIQNRMSYPSYKGIEGMPTYGADNGNLPWYKWLNRQREGDSRQGRERTMY